MPSARSEPQREPNTLVLCFDGTGNTFSGSNADTNVVKLLNKLDRNHPKQYHYYQTGIGTYVINEKSVNMNKLGEITSGISMVIDQGLATTFDAHVMAGYRFLMRYYEAGDKIYVFGFSRGAFTAKFLARMVYKVGLLCKGNEEMVPFAYMLYQRSLKLKLKVLEEENKRMKREGTKNPSYDMMAEHDEDEPLLGEAAVVDDSNKSKVEREYEQLGNEVRNFRRTFCKVDPSRKEPEGRIKVFFLGIWDCVSSVAVLEQTSPIPVPITGTADHVRHAVSVDERRVKFKPALLSQDSTLHDGEDIKEVWFPGNHGDVGGGWPAELHQEEAVSKADLKKKKSIEINDPKKGMTLWGRIKFFFTSLKPLQPSPDPREDAFQLSDISLSWMIRELEYIAAIKPHAAIKWDGSKEGFKGCWEKKKLQALTGPIHDPLQFNRGTAFFKVLVWKFLEVWPFVLRWELEDNRWVNKRFPLNMGSFRDIPKDAVLHSCLKWRLENDKNYHPLNNHGGKEYPCLKDGDEVAAMEVVPDPEDQPKDTDHVLYTFRPKTT